MKNFYSIVFFSFLLVGLNYFSLAQTYNGNDSGQGTKYERWTINDDNSVGGGQPQLRLQGHGEAWNMWYNNSSALVFSVHNSTWHRGFGTHILRIYNSGDALIERDMLVRGSLGLRGDSQIFPSENSSGYLYMNRFNWIVLEANGSGRSNRITFRSAIDNDKGDVTIEDNVLIRNDLNAGNGAFKVFDNDDTNYPNEIGQVVLNGVVHSEGNRDLLFADSNIRLFKWTTQNGLVINGTANEVQTQGMPLHAKENFYADKLSIIGGVSIQNKQIETNDMGGSIEPLTFIDAQGVTIGAGTFKVDASANTELHSQLVKIGGELETLNAEPLKITDAEGVHITAGDLKVYNRIQTRDLDILPHKTVWPDYVFEDSYDLSSLEEVEAYITKNKHLPELPSAVKVAEEGYNQPEMTALLLKKIEELTLHMIEMKKENERLKAKVEAISK